MPNYIKLGNLRIEIPAASGGGGGGGGGSSSLLTGLLAFYNLSDLTDASGNNRTLTNNGGVTFSAGKIGNAANFDGTNYFKVNTGSLFSFASGITFSGWLKLTDQTEVENKFFGAIPTSGPVFYASILGQQFGQFNGQVFADFGHEADNFATNSNNTERLQLDTWAFVAIAVDNSTWNLWINGVKTTFSTPSTINSSNITELVLGAGSQGYDAPFNGQIDAVGIWNRALTDAEITELYNAGAGKEHPFA